MSRCMRVNLVCHSRVLLWLGLFACLCDTGVASSILSEDGSSPALFDGLVDRGLPPILSGFNAASDTKDTKRDGPRRDLDDPIEPSPSTLPPPLPAKELLSRAAKPLNGWIPVTLTLDEGAKTKTVMIRDGAGEAEVFSTVSKGCRDAGVKDAHQAQVLTAKWVGAQRGHDRTQWWFERSGAKNVFQSFFAELAGAATGRPLLALEMGSLEGASAMWLAENLLKHPASLLICLDTWDGGPDLVPYPDIEMPAVQDRFKSNLAKAVNGERVMAMKGDSLLSLAGLVARGLTSSFDAIYVDASHQMKDVLADGLLSFRLLKVGGVMIFDDYVSFKGVGQATSALEEALGDSLEVLFRHDLLVVKKTAEDPWATRNSLPLMGDESRIDAFVPKGAATAA